MTRAFHSIRRKAPATPGVERELKLVTDPQTFDAAQVLPLLGGPEQRSSRGWKASISTPRTATWRARGFGCASGARTGPAFSASSGPLIPIAARSSATNRK